MKNILNRFTIRSLKLNIKRTIATSVGIILSTALICAVVGVFSSFQKTLIKHAIESNGDYHTVFFNVSSEEQKYITENREVKSSFITQGIGYSKLDSGTNDYKPYLYLMEFDDKALKSWGLQLREGKMPENSNELIITKHIEDNGGVNYKIGDKITLNIGKRMAEGHELGQNNLYNNPENSEEENYMEEHLEITESRDFTIVGIVERPNMEIEEYSSPGYTVITKLTEIKDNANIAVKFKNIKDTYKISEEIAKKDSKMVNYNYQTNSELLRWSGVARSDDTITMFYSLAGIVIGIIVISSIFVIRNSFAISITEKMKQYGMLSSIGATKRQIKKNVLFEGMILGIISIPIGILCGIFATFVLVQISTILIGKNTFTNEIEFVFNIPIIAIVLSIILGFLTIYLSCIFSARKASKISPIDAIRSNEDIKIKSKKVKSPKIIRKIFGIGGDIAYKNLKRNKKKYRTTVISLVVSITVFISLSTFINYAFDMSGIYYKEMDYNLSVYAYKQDDSEKSYQYFRNLVQKHNIEDYSLIRTIHITDNDLKNKMTEEYQKVWDENEKYQKEYSDTHIETSITITIYSVGENAYKKYVKEIGGNYEEYKKGIIYYDNSMVYNNNGNRITAFKFQENDEIKGTIVNTEKPINFKILKIADKAPMGISSYTEYGTFLICDEIMNEIEEFNCTTMKINSKDPDKLCKDIEEEYENSSSEEKISRLSTTNYKKEAEEQNRMVLLISIFLYGFIIVISLIGVTNIFNTITTNMNLRSKEFAMLKSVGMTQKEFNKMINLESIFYGIKSLVIGIALGIGISYWIYKVVIDADVTSDLPFLFPIKTIIISIIFIAIIVGIIMRYSLNKINKQNIIETIRNDNI